MPSSKASSQQPLRIGVVGGGTIAGGVCEILMGGLQLPYLSRPVHITKICVKDLSKPRSFHLSEASSLVTDINSILNDDSIDVVVEVMGGTSVAKTVVLEAIKKGKSVVTANKELIAEHSQDIQNAMTPHPSSQFAYEASEGDDFDMALMEAQDVGFTEADPSADVEGHDVRSKIVILAKLAFGVNVPVNDIPCQGITELTPTDFEYAKLLKCTIKLLGTAGRMSRFAQYDGALTVYVSPVMIPKTHLLASAKGTGNCVAINSANMGTCSYTGPGSGRFPTANSVVADIVRIANDTPSSRDPFPLNSKVDLDLDYSDRPFYIRIPFMDTIGIIRKVGELAEKNDISIHSILQNPILDRTEADFCLTTEACKLSQVKALCYDLEQQTDFVRGPPLFMPLLWDHS